MVADKPFAYLDTSFLLSFVLEGSDRFRELEKKYTFISSILILSETASALAREQRLPENWGLSHWTYCSLLDLNAEVMNYHSEILKAGWLRGADLHHLAASEHFFGEEREKHFISLDKSQSKIAKELGYKCL